MKRIRTYDFAENCELDFNNCKFKVVYYNYAKHFELISNKKIYDDFSEIILPERDNKGVFIGETSGPTREMQLYKDGEKIATFRSATMIGEEEKNEHILMLKDDNDNVCFLDETFRTIDNYRVTDFVPTTSFLIKYQYVCKYDGKNKKTLLYDGISENPKFIIDAYKVLNKFDDQEDVVAVRNASMKEGTYKLYSLSKQAIITDIVFKERDFYSEYFGPRSVYYPLNDLNMLFDDNGVTIEGFKYLLDENDRQVIFKCEDGQLVFENVVDYKLDESLKNSQHVVYVWAPLFYSKEEEIVENYAKDPTVIEIVKDENGYYDIVVNGKPINREKLSKYILCFNGTDKFGSENPNQIKCFSIDEDYDILDFGSSNSYRNYYHSLYHWRYGNLNK